MKIKIDPKFKKISENLTRAVKESLGRGVLDGLAQGLAEDVKLQTRLGSAPPVMEGEKKKLAPLKSRTVKKREYMQEAGKLSSDTTPKRSNLTMTGKMLDSLYGYSKDNKIIVEIGDTNRKEIAAYLHEGTPKMEARPFLNLSRLQIKRLTDAINKTMRKLLDVLLK